MSLETFHQPTQTTHRYHTHNSHRSSISTLLVEQLITQQPAPQITACCSSSTTDAAIGPPAAASQEGPTTFGEPTPPTDVAFSSVDFKLNTLDFSLTKRLLGAVFFLLVIYAWKQYIDDEEESDTIYI